LRREELFRERRFPPTPQYHFTSNAVPANGGIMYTILIVDDEANLLEVLAVALENMG